MSSLSKMVIPTFTAAIALFAGLQLKACDVRSHLVPVTSDTRDVQIENPVFCFLAKRNARVESLPVNTSKDKIGAVGIDMNRHGEIVAYYPNADFENKLSKVKTRSELAQLVSKSTKLNDYESGITFKLTSSPLDISISPDSSTAFLLFPRAWTFRDQGFVLDATASGQTPGTHSPFEKAPMLYPEEKPKVAIVDFDRNDPNSTNEERIPNGTKCEYKYELPILISSILGTSQTKVIIDPGIKNNGGPPPG